MAGVKRCGIKVNPDGSLNEEGRPCALKEGHDLKTEPHKPRVVVEVKADDLSLMTGSVSVITETERLSEVRRSRQVDDSPLSQLAKTVVQGAYDAWVRGGKHKKWEDTPAIALNVPAGLESKLRSAVHVAAGADKRRATFGDTKPVLGEDKKPTGVVKVFFQVRDIPVSEAPTATVPVAPATVPAVASPAQIAAENAAAARQARANAVVK